MPRIAAWLCFRDSASYLHEWRRFQAVQGITRFYLYDDDFLFATTRQPPAAVPAGYEAFADGVVCWQLFGTAGHNEFVPEGVIRRFDRRARPRPHVKSLVHPSWWPPRRWKPFLSPDGVVEADGGDSALHRRIEWRVAVAALSLKEFAGIRSGERFLRR